MGVVSDVSTMDVMPRACPIPGEKAAFSSEIDAYYTRAADRNED